MLPDKKKRNNSGSRSVILNIYRKAENIEDTSTPSILEENLTQNTITKIYSSITINPHMIGIKLELKIAPASIAPDPAAKILPNIKNIGIIHNIQQIQQP